LILRQDARLGGWADERERFPERSGEVDREYAAMLRGKTRAIPHSILKIALSILFFKRRVFFGSRASPGGIPAGGHAKGFGLHPPVPTTELRLIPLFPNFPKPDKPEGESGSVKKGGMFRTEFHIHRAEGKGKFLPACPSVTI